MSATETINFSEEAKRDKDGAKYPVQDLISVIDNVLSHDEGLEVAKRALLDQKIEKSAPPKFALMRQHPLLCGNIAFMLLVSAQSTGTFYCTKWMSALPCAHLLNAIQQEKLCQSPWKEMDLMLQHQTLEYIFIGDRPQTPAQYHTRWGMALGKSALNYARNRRNTKLKTDPELAHPLKECTPVSNCLRDGRCVHKNVGTLHLEQLLNKLFETVSQDNATAEGNEFSGIQRKEKSSANKKTNATNAVTPRLSPVEVVQAIEASLSAEIDALKFDYLALHRQCWTLLQRFKAKLSHTVSSMKITPGRFECMDLVFHVLDEYATRVAAAEGMSKKRAAAINPKEQLARFAEVFEEFLQELEQERKGSGRFGELDWDEDFGEARGSEEFEEPKGECWRTCTGTMVCFCYNGQASTKTKQARKKR